MNDHSFFDSLGTQDVSAAATRSPALTPQPDKTELIHDEHHKLEASDLLDDGGNNGIRDSSAAPFPLPLSEQGTDRPSGSLDSVAPAEDVALGNDGQFGASNVNLSTPLGANVGGGGGAPNWLDASPFRTNPSVPILQPTTTGVPIPSSQGFDDVAAATSAVTPMGLKLGAYSTPGSLIDVQPMEPMLTSAAPSRASSTAPPPQSYVANNGPIPFITPGNGPSVSAGGGVMDNDFFASVSSPAQQQQPQQAPLQFQQPTISIQKTADPFRPQYGGQGQGGGQLQQQGPQILTTSPSGSSPSAASIVSLDRTSIAGQPEPSLGSPVKPLPPTPPTRTESGQYAGSQLPTGNPANFLQRPSYINTTRASFSKEPLPTPPVLEPAHENLPTRRWTDPLVFYDIPPRDPVGEIFPKAFPLEANVPRPARKILRAEDVAGAADPLLALVRGHSWRAVAIHVRQLLIRTHPADVPSIMRLWYIRLVALVRLKLYEFANSELMKISNGGDLDNPALRYEAYPDVFGANKSGPMVTFELRAFWARLPSFKGNHHESINRMYTLLYTCRTMIRNAKTEASPSRIWHARAAQLQLQIANLLLDLKDHRAATGILRALVSSYPTDAPLACALGRLYLQLGNTPAARALFDQPRFRSQPPNSPLNLLNKAFLYIAEGDFQAALSPLTALLAHHSDPSLSSTSPPQNVPSTTHALNNLALAHLYTGNVVQAVSFLDSTVIEQPATAGVCPPLLFNLSSLYDLCDATLDRKRRLVAHVVAKYAGDDFDTSCLKL